MHDISMESITAQAAQAAQRSLQALIESAKQRAAQRQPQRMEELIREAPPSPRPRQQRNSKGSEGNNNAKGKSRSRSRNKEPIGNPHSADDDTPPSKPRAKSTCNTSDSDRSQSPGMPLRTSIARDGELISRRNSVRQLGGRKSEGARMPNPFAATRSEIQAEKQRMRSERSKSCGARSGSRGTRSVSRSPSDSGDAQADGISRGRSRCSTVGKARSDVSTKSDSALSDNALPEKWAISPDVARIMTVPSPTKWGDLKQHSPLPPSQQLLKNNTWTQQTQGLKNNTWTPPTQMLKSEPQTPPPGGGCTTSNSGVVHNTTEEDAVSSSRPRGRSTGRTQRPPSPSVTTLAELVVAGKAGAAGNEPDGTNSNDLFNMGATARPPSGERRPPSGERRAPSGERRPPSGERRPPSGERRPPSGERRPPSGERSKGPAKARPSTPASTEQQQQPEPPAQQGVSTIPTPSPVPDTAYTKSLSKAMDGQQAHQTRPDTSLAQTRVSSQSTKHAGVPTASQSASIVTPGTDDGQGLKDHSCGGGGGPVARADDRDNHSALPLSTSTFSGYIADMSSPPALSRSKVKKEIGSAIPTEMRRKKSLEAKPLVHKIKRQIPSRSAEPIQQKRGRPRVLPPVPLFTGTQPVEDAKTDDASSRAKSIEPPDHESTACGKGQGRGSRSLKGCAGSSCPPSPPKNIGKPNEASRQQPQNATVQPTFITSKMAEAEAKVRELSTVEHNSAMKKEAADKAAAEANDAVATAAQFVKSLEVQLKQAQQALCKAKANANAAQKQAKTVTLEHVNAQKNVTKAVRAFEHTRAKSADAVMFPTCPKQTLSGKRCRSSDANQTVSETFKDVEPVTRAKQLRRRSKSPASDFYRPPVTAPPPEIKRTRRRSKSPDFSRTPNSGDFTYDVAPGVKEVVRQAVIAPMATTTRAAAPVGKQLPQAAAVKKRPAGNIM